MSDVRSPDDIAAQHDPVDHDQWWGDPGTHHGRPGKVDSSARSKTPTPTRRRRTQAASVRAPQTRTIGSRVIGNVTRSARASSRVRRALVVAAIAGMVLFGLTCSVGVIMLNDLVIRRSAELGSLDSSRKKLRTDNAKLSADNARLSAPPRVSALAYKRLGMIPSPTMPQYLFLDPDNSPAAPARRDRQRRLAAARVAARAGATTARYRAATSADPSAQTPVAPALTGAT